MSSNFNILGMNRAIDLQEQLSEEFWEEIARKDEIRKQRDLARDAVATLRECDPSGWEKWYNATIPDDVAFPEIVQIVNSRIAELQSIRPALVNP